MAMTNPFEREGQWYKANLHSHTTTSDGIWSPDELVRLYREHGYQILALTDHGKTNDIGSYQADDFLVLQGMEPGAPCSIDGADSYHVVCLNIPDDFQMPTGLDAQGMIDLVRSAGGEVILAHPYWCGLTINGLRAVTGYIAIEVFNTTCMRFGGKGISSVLWDNMLNVGLVVPAVATDDCHHAGDPCKGWAMIKLQELSPGAVMEAVRTGCFYSSCGPTIEDFRVEQGVATLRCSPVMEAHFVCETWHGFSFRAEEGKSITSAECELRDGTRYVRAELVDEKGRRAWTNPIFLA